MYRQKGGRVIQIFRLPHVIKIFIFVFHSEEHISNALKDIQSQSQSKFKEMPIQHRNKYLVILHSGIKRIRASVCVCVFFF